MRHAPVLLLLLITAFTSSADFCEHGSTSRCCPIERIGFDPLTSVGKQRRILCCDAENHPDRVLTMDGICCPRGDVDLERNICNSAFKRGGERHRRTPPAFAECKRRVAEEFRQCVQYCLSDRCTTSPRCNAGPCQKECLKIMDGSATSCRL